MKCKIIFFLIYFSLCSMGIHAQRKIEGNVKDSQTGKNIAFANVILQLQSDTTRNYSVLHRGLSPSKTKITFSSLRYRFT